MAMRAAEPAELTALVELNRWKVVVGSTGLVHRH